MNETKQKRPNFYLLLNLPYDPPVEDEIQIKSAINQKVTEWRKQTNHPKLQQQVKYYLSLKQQIEDVMLHNEQERRREAQEAINQVNEENLRERKAMEKELDIAIKVLVSQGFISDVAIETLAEKFGFTIEEIESKFPEGFRNKDKNPPKDVELHTEIPSLDSSRMKKIVDLLNLLEVNPRIGKTPTLYDFFNMTEDIEEDTILKLAQNMSQVLLRKPPGNATVEYQKDLCGYAKSIFKTSDERQKYDESLKQSRFSNIKLFIDIAAEQGMITAPVYKQLAIQASEEGLEHTEAEVRIKTYCALKKYQLHLNFVETNQDNEKKINQCAYCGTINEENTKCCINCGNDLKQECFVCHTVSTTSNKHCKNCGASFQQMIHFKNLLKDGYSALQLEEVEQAEEMFTRAQLMFDNDEVKTALNRVEEKKRQIVLQVNKVKDEIEQKHFHTAKLEWDKLAVIAKHTEEYDMLKNEITRALYELEQIKVEIPKIEDISQKIFYYVKALQISSDCRWAADELDKIPPLTPGGLRTETDGNGIKLAWTLSEPEGFVEYKIVRKEVTSPESVDDGVLLCTTKQPYFTDNTTESGKKYWYAVYAFRNHLQAPEPVIRGPYLRIEEIKELSATAHKDGIKLTWNPPENIMLEVWKKEGIAPKRPGDGTLLKSNDYLGIFDADVVTGKKYGYTVFTRLEDERRKVNYSKGVSVELFMLEAKPVTNLDYSIETTTINLTWTEPDKGTIGLYGSTKPFSFKQGECHAFSAIQQQLIELPCVQKSRGKAILENQGINELYIVAITVVGEYAVIGNICLIKNIQDVSNIKGALSGNRSLLKWSWPNGIDEVLVVTSNIKFPLTPLEENENQIVYSKDQYESNGGFWLDISEDTDLFICVFSRQEFNGQFYYSRGVHSFQSTKTPPKMTYKVSVKGIFTKKVKLLLSIDQHQMMIPELVVVKKNGSQPLNAKDGQEILKIGPNILQLNETGRKSLIDFGVAEANYSGDTITFDLTSHRAKESYVRIFFNDGEDTKKFTLEPLGKMELG